MKRKNAELLAERATKRRQRGVRGSVTLDDETRPQVIARGKRFMAFEYTWIPSLGLLETPIEDLPETTDLEKRDKKIAEAYKDSLPRRMHFRCNERAMATTVSLIS